MGSNRAMFWHLITRLGEIQILLPAALLAALILVARSESWRTVALWLSLLGVAVMLTLVSKLAFMGWGLGLPEFNFSGISGHAMMATALYPLLLASLVPTQSTPARWLALGAGNALALLVGVSRVVVGAHSWSEVIAGFVVGGAVTAAVLIGYGLPRGLSRVSTAATVAVPLSMALWLTMMPAFGPVFNSHSMITQWSMQLSGRAKPYTRSEMLQQYRQRPVSQAGPA
jgi:membrane-associated phospholipid phosphatase